MKNGVVAPQNTFLDSVLRRSYELEEPCWFLFQISPIKNDDDTVILFLITFKDISHLKDPIAEPTVKKWSRLVEKSLEKQRQHLTKTSDNARSLMSNSAMSSIQYSWEGQKVPRFTIFHYSLFKTIWDWIILILTLYTAVVVPFVVSFHYTNSALLFFNLLVDSVFIADVIMNFKTTYCAKDGEIVLDSRMICMNYLRSWFFIDFIAALPYGILNLTDPNGRWIEIINVIKVIRLIRLLRVARKLDHYLKFGAMTLVLWLFLFCLCCHWMACIWYVIAKNYDKATTRWSWIYILADLTNEPYKVVDGVAVEGSGPSIPSLYMSALYYCMSSLTTCGFGNIAPNTTAEKLFGCVTMLLGCLLYAFIFGQVTSIIQQLQKPSSDYHQRLDSIRRFIKLYTVPEEIGGRLVDYFMTTWATNKGLDIEEVLHLFPHDLQADACLQIHKVVFETMPEFKSAPLPALRNISRYYSATRSPPGAKVIQQGEAIESLFFVERGSLEVRKSDQIVGILGPGDVFGATLNKDRIDKAMYEIHTLTYSDLHTIKVDSLTHALALFPDFFRKFRRELTYSFNLSQKMRVYGSNGKKYTVFGEDETSFTSSKSDVESITASHDQTMVEGQVSMEHLKPSSSAQRKISFAADNWNVDKMDLFTELNVLREDVKTNVNEVSEKINSFDEKINLILGLLQKKIDDSQKTSNSPTNALQINHQAPSVIDDDLNNNPERSLTELDAHGAVQPNINGVDNEATTVDKTDSASNIKKAKNEPSDTRKRSTGRNKVDPSKISKNDNGEAKDGAPKELSNSGGKKAPRAGRPKPNKAAVKQTKKAIVTDDLDELERELEEIGI
eukprot:gene3097-1387_t